MHADCCVLIPAFKAGVAFPNDLMKYLGDKPLLRHAVDRAKAFVGQRHVYVVTDSREIALAAERLGVRCLCNDTLRMESASVIENLNFFLLRIYKKYRDIVITYCYMPLVTENMLRDAYRHYLDMDCDALVSIKQEDRKVFRDRDVDLERFLFDANQDRFLVEVKGFCIFASRLLARPRADARVAPYRLSGDMTEIRSCQDWWVCEKILRRKRIVFRVRAGAVIGLGHVYRALTLAHDISDHEVILVCDQESLPTVNSVQLCGYYPVYAFADDVLLDGILGLAPDMVVNDCLDTRREYVQELRRRGIKVVNFEDVGTGAALADLTINDLYEMHSLDGDNIRWGLEYFFLRDEFREARRNAFRPRVENLLITFGGTDQHDLTRKILAAIGDLCARNDIAVNIVTGPGYLYKDALREEIAGMDYKKVYFTSATDIMSRVMENMDLAVTSNGRTVYELYHMRIPAIVISQHEREATHSFSRTEHGFVNMGCYESRTIGDKVRAELARLLDNPRYRRNLYSGMGHYDFIHSRSRIVAEMLSLFEPGERA